ncbi:amidohydrolase family protein [Mesorhizobium sp. IMUNJ 23232]|uniref:amidohydrolase family protein n=1 Tax=Mesorhizobium sp. IMUNJ 23232 TaxID=3376064 RepID=UPI0037886234
MIVDAHLHLFRNGYDKLRTAGSAREVDAYELLMDRHGIATGLVVCYEADGIDPGNNAYVRELARTRPWINSLAFFEPHPTPTVGRIEELLAAGHIGIAVYLPDTASAQALCGWPQAIWERLGRAHAIVSFNARPEAIGYLQALVERATECAFLFSHLGLPGPQEGISTSQQAAERLDPLLRLASRPNVGVKLSGLYAVDSVPPHPGARPFVEVLLQRFAPSNLHWGSDFSPALGFVSFEETMAVPGLEFLVPADRDMVFGEGLMAKMGRAGLCGTGQAGY